MTQQEFYTTLSAMVIGSAIGLILALIIFRLLKWL